MKTLKCEERENLNIDTLKPNFDIEKLYNLAGVVYLNVAKYIQNIEIVRVEKRNNRGSVLYYHNGEESDELDNLEAFREEVIYALRHNINRENDNTVEVINDLYIDYYE